MGLVIGHADTYLTLRTDPDKAMTAVLAAAKGGEELINRIDRVTRLGVGRERTLEQLNDLAAAALIQALRPADHDHVGHNAAVEVHPGQFDGSARQRHESHQEWGAVGDVIPRTHPGQTHVGKPPGAAQQAPILVDQQRHGKPLLVPGCAEDLGDFVWKACYRLNHGRRPHWRPVDLRPGGPRRRLAWTSRRHETAGMPPAPRTRSTPDAHVRLARDSGAG